MAGRLRTGWQPSLRADRVGERDRTVDWPGARPCSGTGEDFIIHGRGLDLPVLVRDFELLKWIGANSFRTSHYPYSEEAMMLADEYGFLVIGETPAVSLAFSDPDPIVEARRVQLRSAVSEDLVARDKNHPLRHPLVHRQRAADQALPHHGQPPPEAVGKGTRFFADIFAHTRGLDSSRGRSRWSACQGGPAGMGEPG